MMGVRPRPPPTQICETDLALRCDGCTPMSCTATTARSDSSAPLTAILNLRGRKANSGWKVDHWRISSQ
jgi:hypothetical protein